MLQVHYSLAALLYLSGNLINDIDNYYSPDKYSKYA